ncbi:MAG: hypothetical protein AABY22_08335, partial [Nanoarchaeota archaeon]
PGTFPSGYTKWRRIGSAWNNASSNLYSFRKVGKKVFFGVENKILDTSSPAGATWTTITMGNIIPPNASIIYISLNIQDNDTSAGVILIPNTNIDLNVGSPTQFRQHVLATGATDAQVSNGNYPIPNPADATLRYYTDGTENYMRVGINGYEEDF